MSIKLLNYAVTFTSWGNFLYVFIVYCRFFCFASFHFQITEVDLHLGSLYDPSTVSQLCYRDSVSPHFHSQCLLLADAKIWVLHYQHEKLLKLLTPSPYLVSPASMHHTYSLALDFFSSNSIFTCSSKLSVIKRTSAGQYVKQSYTVNYILKFLSIASQAIFLCMSRYLCWGKQSGPFYT